MTSPIAPVAATPAPASSEQKKLRAVAEQFEAVMLRQLIGSMRQASLADGMFDSNATEQFREMGDARTAEAMAHQGALHIADLLVKQFGARIAPAAAAPVAEPAAASGGKPE